MYGYISEHHGYGMTAQESGEYAEDLAATMLASTLGIDFDPDAAWNERKRVYEHSQLIIDSMSMTAAAQGDRRANGPAWSLAPCCGFEPDYASSRCVIASEAKQSRGHNTGLWIASALRASQ